MIGAQPTSSRGVDVDTIEPQVVVDDHFETASD